MKTVSFSLLFLGLITFFSCSVNDPQTDDPSNPIPHWANRVMTDKSRYNPGDAVQISISLENSQAQSVKIAFKHLTTLIEERVISVDGTLLQVTWNPPATDFKGYVVEISFIKENDIIDFASTAIDVSSDWTKFPRYGFLSEFGSMSADTIESRLSFLNLFHINGLQYYDWHNKHHIPLPVSGGKPAETWQDIAKRNISFETVKSYIAKAKTYQMASMSYNLLYGAWSDFENDGVSYEWMIFNDRMGININRHDLDDAWALSDIFVVNPANQNWQNYIFSKTELIYEHLDFDGWHLDQLGHRGNVYDYSGTKVDLWNAFVPFLNNLNTKFPNKKMVLNAVNQYGQLEIVGTPVNFSYTEVWNPNDTYTQLASIIQQNIKFNSEINTVIAAYMNYSKADKPGTFNEASVIMTDAVILAFGGNHIELGEHMLGKEYFPNKNLSMTDALKSKLVEYYDFQVGYQNLLRDGGTLSLSTSLTGNNINVTGWNPTLNKVSSLKKSFSDKTVYHLINFYGLNSLNWRDTNGTQSPPEIKENITLNIPLTELTKITYASPDWQNGVQKELAFSISGNSAVVTVPYLEYWGILIVE